MDKRYEVRSGTNEDGEDGWYIWDRVERRELERTWWIMSEAEEACDELNAQEQT